MQAQTMKRYLGNQFVAIGLAAGVALAGIGVVSTVDIFPSRGSDSIAVEQPKPVFHRPADRPGVSIDQWSGSGGRSKPAVNRPTDERTGIGVNRLVGLAAFPAGDGGTSSFDGVGQPADRNDLIEALGRGDE